MTRHILILGRKVHPDGKETATEIFNGLQPYFNDDFQLHLAHYRDLVFDIAPGNVRIDDQRNKRDLSNYDAVLMTNWFSHASIRKDIALSLALFFEAKGIPCFNTESLHSRSTSKLSQMMLAALHDVPVPRTIFSLSYKVLTEALQSPAHSLGLPFVLKNAQASRGQGNYLIRAIDELPAHEPEHTEATAFIAQSFVASDHSDFRLFITGGKVQFIIQRIGSEDSHLHNTSQGAATNVLQVSDFDARTIAMAEKMAGLLHREVTGLDIIFEQPTGMPYFLEANPIPQIATGSNVDAKLSALAMSLKHAAERSST